MGLIISTLRVLHPVRAVRRSVYRAVVPRPIRRAQVLGGAIRHPMSEVRYQAIGVMDRAVTPRRGRRRNQTYSPLLYHVSPDGRWRWDASRGPWLRIRTGNGLIAVGLFFAGWAGIFGIDAINVGSEQGASALGTVILCAVLLGVLGVIGDLLVLAGAREKAS